MTKFNIKAPVSDVSADEKRRSAADFRDSSFVQTTEKLSVSVKAISALYLSKAGTKESANSPVKLVHVTSPLLFSSPLTIESKLV